MTDQPSARSGSTPAFRRRGRALTITAELYRTWLLPASLLLGVVLRTREWLFRKSLWIDEIAVTDNLTRRDFAGLLKPLSGNQGGPVGWLWAEKASIELFGVNELALRLVPWLASLVALAVFPLVVRRIAGPLVAPAATLLLATSPVLIYYAAETKQYSSDTACALLVVLGTLLVLQQVPDWRSGIGWGAACGVLIWCSQPAILVAAACALVLVLRWVRQRAALLRLAPGLVLLVASLGAEWLVSLRQLSTNRGLQSYWEGFGGYPAAGATVGGELSWAVRAGGAYVHFLHYALPVVVLLSAGWGLATIARLRTWPAILLALIGLAAVGAAVTRHYPLAHRLALYLLPVLIVLMCAGLADGSRQTGAGRLPDRWRVVAVALTAVALLATTAAAVGVGVSKLWRPDENAAGRQLIRFVADHRQPSDAVLTDTWGRPALTFYGSRAGVPQTGLMGFQAVKAGSCPADPLAGLAGTDRVWVLLIHHPANEPANRDAIYESQFAAHATLVTSFTGPPDVAAYLFDLRQVPTAPARPLSPWIRNGCLTIKAGTR